MELIRVIVLIALATTAASINPCGPFKSSKGAKVMKFYVWDVIAPYQNQEVTVQPFPGQPPTRAVGSGYSIYNKLTAVPVYNSTECGRNQGYAVITSPDLTTLSLHLAHRFYGLGYLTSDGLYNGSEVFNEQPVYGGVGVFKGAEGSFKTQTVDTYGPNDINVLIGGEIYYKKSP